MKLNRPIFRPVSFTLILAIVAYTLIPHVIAAREAARLTICNNRLRTCCPGYCAHKVIIDDEFAIVQVESDPLYTFGNGGVDDPYCYGFFCKVHESGDVTRRPTKGIPSSIFEDAQRQVKELRSSKDFLYRQGRTPAQRMAVE